MVARADSDFTQLPGKPDLKIDGLYAFVAHGPEGEGIMAASMIIDGQLMMMPMVGADLKRVQSLLPTALEISRASGTPFKIYRFDNKTDITEEVKLS